MKDKFKIIYRHLFPLKTKWQDVIVYSALGVVVLVQYRRTANNRKEFRSVKVCEFRNPSDVTQEKLEVIGNAIK